MCRYGLKIYKPHFACFNCRKVFRQSPIEDLPGKTRPVREARIVPCPQCGARMHNMGLDFKAPKQKDLEHWEKVRILYANGFAYHSCGCDGPGYRPARLREVPAFLGQNKQGSESEGERLLERFSGEDSKQAQL